MADNESQKSKPASDKYIPPPMDPYATYQTPYDRRGNDPPNPFIEFRRFADKQMASMLEGFGSLGFPQMFNMADESKKFHRQFERDMQALHDKGQEFEEEMRRLTEHDTNKAQDAVREKSLETSTTGPMAERYQQGQHRSLQEESSHHTPAKSSLPDGWVRATTSDGKIFFIEQATGTATNKMPLAVTKVMPPGWERRIASSGRPYYLNHNSRTTTWDDPSIAQDKSRSSELTDEERAEVWKRGFRNCPELKKHTDETELDVYERLDEQQQKDLAQLSRQIKERGERWRRGFQNCPELQKLDDGTELAMYEELNKHKTESVGSTNICPWGKSNSPLGWRWPVLGHDGMRRAKQLPLPDATDDENFMDLHDMKGTMVRVPVPNLLRADADNLIGIEPFVSTRDINGSPVRLPTLANMHQGDSGENFATLEQQRQKRLTMALERLGNCGLDAEDIVAAVQSWEDGAYNEDHAGHELRDLQQRGHEAQKSAVPQESSSLNSTSARPNDEENKPSIVSTMTRTTSRTLFDGSVETRRVLKKRFADGREESEESTDISQAVKANRRQDEKPGWFWN